MIIPLVVFIIVLILILLGIVVIPSITVAVDELEYQPDDTVSITGVLAGHDPQTQTVNSIISPPTGDDYIGPSTTPLSNGDYSTSWIVPSDAIEGTYTLTVSAGGGLTATTTFIVSDGIMGHQQKTTQGVIK